MQKFKRFYFEGFEYDDKTLKAKFYYSFDNIEKFTEEVDFSTDILKIRKKLDLKVLDNFLFPLSIALGISYYKLYPTDELVVKTGFLSDEDKKFWQKFYKNGLGEFLYKNKISPDGLFNFVNENDKFYPIINFNTSENILLPIGGGKDSIVSAELLLENKYDFTPIVFGKIDEIKQNCLDIMGKKVLLVKRKIDENLFRLNDFGYYNGHVPITGIISFVLLTTAYLYDYKYIILSNEKSANSGNTYIGELEVNHQYSKSLKFEKDLKEYIERNLSSNIKYFSLLRGMYEIKIAKIFSKIGKKYFGVFSSCNSNFKINGPSVIARKEAIQKEGNNVVNGLLHKNSQGQDFRFNNSIWCNSCPKCAFVYSILRPFISDEETMQIFSKELYEDNSLENLFLELLGIQGIKPFECVGEKEEVAYAMNRTLNNYIKSKKEIPYILKIFEKKVKTKLSDDFFKQEKEKLFNLYNEKTLIPEKFRKIVI